MISSWGVVVSFDVDNMEGTVNVAGGVVTASLRINDDFLRMPAAGEFWILRYQTGSYAFERPFDRDKDTDQSTLLPGDTLVSSPEWLKVRCKALSIKDESGEFIDEMSHTVLPSRLPLQWLVDLIDKEIAKSK